MFVKDLKITLYDIFGYLLPGIVMLAALSIMTWELPHARPLPIVLPGIQVWIIILFVSYLLGHMIQTLWNWTVARYDARARIIGETPDFRKDAEPPSSPKTDGSHEGTPDDEVGFFPKPLNAGIVAAASKKVKETFHIEKEKVDSHLLFDLCDELVVQHGNADVREIYEYREGFYRGMAISFSLLAIALFWWLFSGSSYEFQGRVTPIPIFSVLLVGALGSIFAVAAMLSRYFHFLGHRITAIILGSLVVESKLPTKP